MPSTCLSATSSPRAGPPTNAHAGEALPPEAEIPSSPPTAPRRRFNTRAAAAPYLRRAAFSFKVSVGDPFLLQPPMVSGLVLFLYFKETNNLILLILLYAAPFYFDPSNMLILPCLIRISFLVLLISRVTPSTMTGVEVQR